MAGLPADEAAVARYRALVRERLAGATCPGCGGGLQGAEVIRVADATSLEDYVLSEAGQARLAAATEHWVVRCTRCFAESQVGEAAATPVAPSPVSIPPPMPWAPAAIEIYRSGVRERLAEASCEACGGPVADAVVL